MNNKMGDINGLCPLNTNGLNSPIRGQCLKGLQKKTLTSAVYKTLTSDQKTHTDWK